jgi:hypothetical protein
VGKRLASASTLGCSRREAERRADASDAITAITTIGDTKSANPTRFATPSVIALPSIHRQASRFRFSETRDPNPHEHRPPSPSRPPPSPAGFALAKRGDPNPHEPSAISAEPGRFRFSETRRPEPARARAGARQTPKGRAATRPNRPGFACARARGLRGGAPKQESLTSNWCEQVNPARALARAHTTRPPQRCGVRAEGAPLCGAHPTARGRRR